MLSESAMAVIEGRGLDVELVSKIGITSEIRKWPVDDGNGGTTWHHGEAIVLPFVRDGKVVRRKFKRTTNIEGAPPYLQEKDGIRIAFNEDCLKDDSLVDQPLIVTEGELDAVAAIQSGFLRTISVPDGAPPPKERTREDLEALSKYDWLSGIRALTNKDRAPYLILATDGDENGAALLHDLSLLFGRARCKFLTYPKAKKDRGRERCKDLNEVLEDYGVKGVVETVNRAQWIALDGVYRMSELAPLPAMRIYHPRHNLFSENFRLRMGDFSVITGTPGFGKTSFANDVLCGIATDHNLVIGWASFEQEPQRDHRRSLRTWFHGQPEHTQDERQRAAADAWIDRHHRFFIPREDEDATLEWVVEKMEQAVVRDGCSIIVLDPWNEIEHARNKDETETEYIGRAIRLLKRFAKSFQVHVMVIAHPTKSVKDADGQYKMPTLYDIAGSANWYNKADLGVIVHRENEDDTIIKVQKSRYHDILGKPGEVRMQFSRDERKFIEIERVS